MHRLTKDFIRKSVADSPVIYKRGENLFRLGNFTLNEVESKKNAFHYFVDGDYGDYDVKVKLDERRIVYSCTCPYPSDGCKHTVAVCLDIMERAAALRRAEPEPLPEEAPGGDEELTYEDLRNQTLESRHASAQAETFTVVQGETYKGEHLLRNVRGKEYTVTLHDPLQGKGHCTCPDFDCNRLGTCKHLIHLHGALAKKRDFAAKSSRELFPFVHVYWDSSHRRPRFFYDRPLPTEVRPPFEKFFDREGLATVDDLCAFYELVSRTRECRSVRIDEHVMARVSEALFQREVAALPDSYVPDFSCVRAALYPYQQKGVRFALFRKSAIIADEMGLGKTLQAITIALLKKEVFNFRKVLIVTPASLKEQWRREIERFTDEKVTVISGGRAARQDTYAHNTDYFKITNYEAVLRDGMAIHRFNPDLIILDEAQRIKNFEAKTSQAIKSIPHRQSLVLTGTPLENKLEDVYSIVQFADAELLTPLWEFAARHFILRKEKKNRIFGYRNLAELHEKLKPLVIRRRKEEVLEDLPESVTNTYYVELTREQMEMHQGFLQALAPILSKKFLTPMDIRRIQELLLAMRMACDSTYLVDKKTNLSPKLRELESILSDLVVENGRKVVIFSEWTTMTYLIGKVLSAMGIPFVEFTGKVPVDKRQLLITEFHENPDCKVFLSTDAGGVGLNLQVADCVVNFELPWNPARLNQRIGRVLRIGQKSTCVNVVNLVAKSSIEEKVLASISLKQELFDGVFDGGTDFVEFSQEKRAELINKLRAMLGEDPVAPATGCGAPEELPETTPHFLNPKALGGELDIPAEEAGEEAAAEDQAAAAHGECEEESARSGAGEAAQPEKVEEVLESGMRFLSGLMAMATGKPLVTETDQKMVTIDKATGEVTLKFKLPVF